MDTLQNSLTASTPSSDNVTESNALLDQLGTLEAPELRRLLAHYLTQQKLGLYWEHNDIERDRALNDVALSDSRVTSASSTLTTSPTMTQRSITGTSW